MQGRSRQAILVFGRQLHVLDLPNHRTLLRVFDAKACPGLVFQVRRPVEMMLNALRRRTAGAQPRHGTPASPTMPAVRAIGHIRSAEPTCERARHLSHIGLLASIQLPQKLGLAAVSFVERQVAKRHAVGPRMIVELQSDLPLWPIHHLVGDMCRATTRAIFRPAFRQEQIAVQ